MGGAVTLPPVVRLFWGRGEGGGRDVAGSLHAIAIRANTAPVGTLPSPTSLPPEFKNAEEGTNSYNIPAPARITVFWLPKTSQAKPNARRPIAVIGVVGSSDPFANLHKAARGVGVEVAQLVVGIRPNRAQLIAHAEVDGEPGSRPVVVLDESGKVIRVHIPDRIALEDSGT